MPLRWFTLIGALLIFFIPAVGQTNDLAQNGTTSSAGLSDAAEKTYANYNRAIQSGTENRPDSRAGIEIPSKYWTDPIKALKPFRIYIHRINIVVVQHVQGAIEEGKYIYISISSYLPMNGVDGFEYSADLWTGNIYHLHEVLDFKRNRGK